MIQTPTPTTTHRTVTSSDDDCCGNANDPNDHDSIIRSRSVRRRCNHPRTRCASHQEDGSSTSTAMTIPSHHRHRNRRRGGCGRVTAAVSVAVSIVAIIGVVVVVRLRPPRWSSLLLSSLPALLVPKRFHYDPMIPSSSSSSSSSVCSTLEGYNDPPVDWSGRNRSLLQPQPLPPTSLSDRSVWFFLPHHFYDSMVGQRTLKDHNSLQYYSQYNGNNETATRRSTHHYHHPQKKKNGRRKRKRRNEQEQDNDDSTIDRIGSSFAVDTLHLNNLQNLHHHHTDDEDAKKTGMAVRTANNKNNKSNHLLLLLHRFRRHLLSATFPILHYTLAKKVLLQHRRVWKVLQKIWTWIVNPPPLKNPRLKLFHNNYHENQNKPMVIHNHNDDDLVTDDSTHRTRTPASAAEESLSSPSTPRPIPSSTSHKFPSSFTLPYSLTQEDIRLVTEFSTRVHQHFRMSHDDSCLYHHDHNNHSRHSDKNVSSDDGNNEEEPQDCWKQDWRHLAVHHVSWGGTEPFWNPAATEKTIISTATAIASSSSSTTAINQTTATTFSTLDQIDGGHLLFSYLHIMRSIHQHQHSQLQHPHANTFFDLQSVPFPLGGRCPLSMMQTTTTTTTKSGARASGCYAPWSIENTLEWRRTYQPWKVDAAVLHVNQQGWIYVRGLGQYHPPSDNNVIHHVKNSHSTLNRTVLLEEGGGRHAILWVRPGLYRSHAAHHHGDGAAWVRTIVHGVDRAVAHALAAARHSHPRSSVHVGVGVVGKFNVIMDVRGYEWGKTVIPNLSTMKQLVTLLQDHFPNRLGIVGLLHLSRPVEWILHLIKPLLTQDVRNKIHVLHTEDLVELVEPSNLPMWLGGHDTYEFDVDTYYNTRHGQRTGDWMSDSSDSTVVTES